MQYLELYPLGGGAILPVTTKERRRSGDKLQKQMAEFLGGPNLSSPINPIGPQQSGLIAQCAG